MVEEKAAEISEYYAQQVSLYKEMLAIAQELKACALQPTLPAKKI